MLVNEYKPEFYDRKVRKMRNLGNVYICGSPFVMSRTDAQNGLYSIFKNDNENAQNAVFKVVIINTPSCWTNINTTID